MNRTAAFVLIGVILGAAVGAIGAYFDNSGAANQKVSSMIFCGVCGALLLGLLGFGIAKVDNNPTPKPAPQKPKRDPKTQFAIECAGSVGLIALSASNLAKLSESSAPGAFGAIVGGIVGVLIFIIFRAYWLFGR